MFDDFYGLDGRPFQLTPDPAFYFESLTHRKALSYLGYGLAQGEGFVVITGEVGAGKSTLVAHLMATIDPARLTAAQVVTSRLDSEEIVHVVAQAFGLLIDGHDKAGALGAIEAFLHEEARSGRRCLLIVDESQNLSIEALEELRMLSNFQLGAHPLLQTLLLGQPEFRDTLRDHCDLEQLRQRVIATYHLQAMEAKEVQPYIEHRLNCVGWTGNPAFDQRVFTEIHEATGGIPRRINQIVNRLLLLGAVDQRTRIDSAMLHQVLAELAEDGAIALPQVAPSPGPAAGTETADEVVLDAVAGAGDEPACAEEELAEAVEELVSEPAEAEDEESAESIEVFVSEPEAVQMEQDEPAEVSQEFFAEADEADVSEGGNDSDATEADGEPASEARQGAGSINFTEPFEKKALPESIEETLAEQDAQIAALRQAVYDLAEAANGADKDVADSAVIAELTERIATLEGRLLEQDLTIRHTLTMLIEWIESDGGGREAA